VGSFATEVVSLEDPRHY